MTERSVQIGALIVAALAAGSAAREDRDWPAYGGGPEQARYSTLAQIDRSNVGRLELAWTYDSGETGGLQTNPIIVRGVLYTTFLDQDGYPAIQPPWGTLNAINLNTGALAWSVPLGEYPELAAKGMKNTGSENYGGPIVTAGGLVFIGATNFDRKFRAFDARTGERLWETTLPFSGNGTPATYEIDGRQFIVVPAGGGKSRSQAGPGGVVDSGGTYVAYALPGSPR